MRGAIVCVLVLVQVCVCAPAEHSRNLHAILRMFLCVKGEKIICFCGEQSKGRMETIAVIHRSGA